MASQILFPEPQTASGAVAAPADVSILLADWKPETMRELIQVEVENSPSDKAEWEADRAELLRLGIVEEAVLDQMEVIWGAKVNLHLG